MYDLDSAHVLHVAKTGNDANAGHAQQYPVAFGADAKLTIGSALGAAVDGDIIVIWPGTYDETVDIETAAIGVTLVGTKRGKCIINPTTTPGHAVIAGDNCDFYKLTMIGGLGGAYAGLVISGKHDIEIEKCNILGPSTASGMVDGILGGTAYRVRVIDSYVYCTYDCIQIAGGYDWRIQGCFIFGDGANTNSGPRGISTWSAWGKARGIVKDTEIRMEVTAANSNVVKGIEVARGLVIDNCPIFVQTSDLATGATYGIYARDTGLGNGTASIHNCNIETSSNGGSEKDLIADPGSDIVVSGSRYDSSKVAGPVKAINSGWAAAVNAEVDTALNTAIPGSPVSDSINQRIKAVDDLVQASGAGDLALVRKILKNKAVQTKATGVIVIYDDDGTTPILTFTPTDTASTITRTPG